MTERLVLIHTVPPLIDVFTGLVRELLPGVEVKHILDEPLLEMVRRRGHLSDSDAGRLKDHVALAEQIGARAVLVTCSTISPLVDRVRPLSSIWVEKIDEAMIVEAVKEDGRIGVLATNQTTLFPTRLMIEEQARCSVVNVKIDERLVPDALNLLLEGDGGGHDRLVIDAIADLASRVDRIILAQASMARVLAALPNKQTVPILSSPHLALAHIQAHFKLKKLKSLN